jgi:energy-coupling factor transporter ATP-binding protein EcfA2
MVYFHNQCQSFDKFPLEKKIAMRKVNITSPEVNINLYESSEARKFNEGEIINFYALEKAKKLIDRRIPTGVNHIDNVTIAERNQDKFTIRANNTIAILGGRGSGKTSFIHSLKSFYDSDSSDVLTLDIIDPTLVETKGHILLHVISLLDTYAEEFRNKAGSYSNDIVRNHEKMAWSEALAKLAKGLCSIDGIDSKQSAEWNDDSYVLQMGMSEVSSARMLESNLNALVDKALKYAKKKALVIFFDDIDIDIAKAWKVLEVVRKYLTSPKIITVVSGDEELLSLAVRKAQWSIFGKEFLQAEEKNKNVLDGIRQSVEEQYFQKVLKPENRVHLLTLYDLTDRTPKVFLSVKTSGVSSEKIQIDFAYRKLLRLVGIYTFADMDNCLNLLLNLPLRSQIQLLKAILEEYPAETDRIYSLAESLQSVFYFALLQSGVSAEDLLANPNFIVSRILQYLANEEQFMLFDYYQLQPISLSNNKNQTLFMLGSIFSLSSRNRSHLFLDYMLRIGYVRNSVGQGIRIPTFLFEDRDMRNLMGYYIAETETTFGNIKIYTFDKIRKQRDKRGIDTEFAGESLLSKTLAYLPVCNISHPEKQNSINYYSLPYLLGFMYDILRAKDEEIPSMLARATQVRSYSSSNKFFENDSINEEIAFVDTYNGFEKKNDSIGFTEYKAFIDSLIYWKENQKDIWQAKRGYAVNPLLLGRIMTRYSNAASNNKDNASLGKSFSLQIEMFLNSVLVEESLWGDQLENHDLNLNNPIKTNRNFTSNVKKIKNDTFPLFGHFVTCPLLQAYSHFSDPGSYLYQSSLAEGLGRCFLDFYSKLNEVLTVQGIRGVQE